jgi:hypothetical protein
MKIRIKGNSLRLRLLRSEVARFLAGLFGRDNSFHARDKRQVYLYLATGAGSEPAKSSIHREQGGDSNTY